MIDVEELIIAGLEDMVPLPDGKRADWADVLRRVNVASAHRRWCGPLSSIADGERRRWKPLLVAAVVTTGLALAGVAIADGFGAFNGISAAQHPQSIADTLNSEDLPPDCNNGSPSASQDPFCHLVLSSARLLRTLPDGGKLWAVTNTHGDLCVLLQNGAASCSTGLTPSQPTTITTAKLNNETPAISWGIALDSVTAVSFPADGREVTVPVENNVWFYQGDNSGLASMTIHFNDGRTERPESDTSPSSGG